MGSLKYPDENGFDAFLKKHGVVIMPQLIVNAQSFSLMSRGSTSRKPLTDGPSSSSIH